MCTIRSGVRTSVCSIRSIIRLALSSLSNIFDTDSLTSIDAARLHVDTV